MKIAKIASNKGVGPHVYNTRTFYDSTNGRKYAVIAMEQLLNAKSVKQAFNNYTLNNFHNVQAAINAMHREGIHHGNLHFDNILVYKNRSNHWAVLPINFGSAKYNNRIHNANSAVKYAIGNTNWRGRPKSIARMVGNEVLYERPGRKTLVRSNKNALARIKKYFNRKRG